MCAVSILPSTICSELIESSAILVPSTASAASSVPLILPAVTLAVICPVPGELSVIVIL